jgi:hypothetical protein
MAVKAVDFKIKVDGKELDLTKTSINEFNQIYSDAQKKLQSLPLGDDQWKQLNKELQNADTAFQQTKDTLTETEGKFKSLRLQIRQATVAFQEAEEKGDIKSMKKLKKDIDDLNDQFEITTLKAMKFEDALATMPGVAGFVGQSIQGVDKAFKVLVANPLLAIVTGLVGAFMFLKEALGKTKEGTAALNKVSQAFSAIMGPLLALINTVAVPIFEALANVITKVAGAFSFFAEKLGVSKASIAAATKDVDKVGQEAAENEKKRQEDAKAAAEKEAARKQAAKDKAIKDAEDEKKRKQDLIKSNEDLKQSEDELARSKVKASADPIQALKDEQVQKDEDYQREKKRIEDLKNVKGTTAEELKQLTIEQNNLEATYLNDKTARDQKIVEENKKKEEEIIKQKQEAFEKEKELFTTQYETLAQQRTAADEKELQDLDLKLASGELKDFEYQRKLYETKKRQLDDKNTLLKEDEQKEKDFYLNLYNNGKITKEDYEKQLLEIQKNYGQLKLENQKETGVNEFENAKAQAQLLVDLKRFQVEAETALEQAKIDALQMLGNIVAGLAGKNKGLQITALLIQQAASVAQILSRSAAAKAGAVATAAPLLANPITAIPAAVALKAALAANTIATITGLAGVGLAVGTGISQINSAGGGSTESSGSKSGSGPASNGMGRAYATGGIVRGPGSGTSDSIPARLSNGEAVMTAQAVNMFGPLLSQMNQAGGGVGFTPSVSIAGPDRPKSSFPTDANQTTQIIKTYVVEGELTTAQQRQARLKDLSTI